MSGEEESKVNVTSYYQSGGITAQTVNVGLVPRRFAQETADSIVALIQDRSASVEIISSMGDGEALQFATEIFEWMKANGYTQVRGVNQAMWGSPVLGNRIEPKPDGSFAIVIGTNNGTGRPN